MQILSAEVKRRTFEIRPSLYSDKSWLPLYLLMLLVTVYSSRLNCNKTNI